MINFEKFELKNGLKVLVHTDKTTPIVAMNVLYNVGARDEDENKTGFAHLFEHLMFGGSKNIPDYDGELQNAGGENNAFTSNDITNYYITLPSQNIETAFWLESDRMNQLDFSEEKLKIQQNVVIEEYKQRYLNQPYGDVWLMLRPMAYKVHPYKWATIGKEIAHIENAKLADVKDFFYRFYAPNNANLVVAGNITVKEVETLAEKWFGDIEKRFVKQRSLPKEPPQSTGQFMEVKKNVPYDAIYKVFHMCNRRHQDFYACDMISDILSNGKSSRLYENLVKKKQLFSDINAFITGDIDPGLFVISGKLIEGIKMKDAEYAINEELENLKTKRLDNYELDKIKNRIESVQVFGETQVLNKAMNLAFFELLGNAKMVNQEIDKYRAVNSENIQNIANGLFKENNTSTLYYLAEKK